MERREAGPVGPARLARLGLYALVLPWLVVCLSDTTHGLRLYLTLLVALAASFAAGVRLAPGLFARRGTRILDLVLWNLVLCLLGAELATRLILASGAAPAWLSAEPDQLRYRLDPAREWLGTRPNAQGFYDEEFARARRPGVLRVVALGDSYAVGMVPYAENYLTRLDALLGDRIEVLNLGVVHMAMRQYLEILQSDGLPLAPDVVLVGIYIGNDIQEDPPRGLFSRWGSRALTGLQRAFTVLVLTEPGNALPTERIFRLEPDGTRVEIPVMSVEKHHAREWKHLEQLFGPPPDAAMREAWEDTERALSELVSVCRERGIPVLASLAPDEIQVSPALLQAVASRYGADPGRFDLDYPARRLGRLLARLGVPVLDLTPALREAERDGPTYHPRAVHWNGRGNAAAAEALAPWLAGQLQRLGLAPAADPRGN